MQINKFFCLASTFALLLGCDSADSVQAASITNLDAAVTLNLGGSWVGGTPAGASDTAVWNNLVQVNTTKALGANVTWAGMQILDPATLVTISAGNTLALGASGIDMSAATNGLTLSAPVALSANQTWNVTNGQTLTAGGIISGASLLTLNNGGNNGGSILLNGANTYTGGTVINSGIVQPNVAASFGTGAVTNNGGAMLFASLANGGIIVNTFRIAGPVLLDMNNRNTSVVLDGAFSGSGTLYITNDTASGSTLTLGGNGNGSGNFTGFTGSLIVASNASTTASAGNIRFNNGGGNNNLGNAGMIFDLGNGNVHFTEKNSGTTATFGALYGGAGTQLATAENYIIGALNLNTTFAGTILGASTLAKNGTGVLTLTGNNTYTGATTINAGVVQIGDGVTTVAGSLGTGAVVINTGGQLVLNKPDDFAVNNNISGAGSMSKTNTSNLTYGGTDTSSGTFTVSQGVLTLGGAGVIAAPLSLAAGTVYDVTANPAYTLSSTLSGSGTIFGLLTASSGSLNPGGTGAAATLTFSNGLSELGNLNHQLELSSPAGSNDLINVVGDLTLAGTNNLILSHFGGGNIPNGLYTLINYSGNLNGALNNLAVTVAGVSGTLTNLPNKIAIIIAPSSRGTTNLTWHGDGVANNWDTSSSNWVNGATSFAFQAGDKVTFDNSGAANSTVTISSLVSPGSVTFNSTANYTLTGIYGISDATGPTGLVKTNSGALSISATNSYTGVTVVGSGTLEVFNVANGGSASAIGSAGSSPTNLVFYGATYKYSGGSAATDRGATLNGSGLTVDVASGVNLTENGILTGPGSLTLVDSGTLTLGAANSYAGGTVISNGVLATANDNANTSGFGPTNNPITIYGGTLALYRNNGDDGSTVYSFYNPLVVPAGQTANFNVFQRGNVSGSLTGGGVLNVSALGQRAGFVGNWSAFTGTINITGNFRVGNPLGYSNAVINLNDSADLDGGNAGGTYSSTPTFDIGELDGTSLASLGVVSKPSPNPTWRIGWKNTTSTFAGPIQNPAGGVNNIVKVGTGTLILEGQDSYTGSTIVSNGVLALANNPGTGSDGVLSGSTNIFINAGAFFDVLGRSDTTMPLNSAQVVSGNGTIRGILDTTSGGTVSPGGGINGGLGTLTVTSNINLGGTAWMKLNRGTTPNSDQLVSSTAGIINYGGTLVLTNLGARLQTGDTFTLFNAAVRNGSFTLALPNYYTWDTSQLNTSGRVSVTGVAPAPRISGVDFSGLAAGSITLNAINGAPSSPVTVLTTTNLALPVGNWTQVGTSSFDGSGNLSFPITVDPTLPQSYFLLQAN